MLLRTVVTVYDAHNIGGIARSMVASGLAQNVETGSNITGDYVSPDLLGLSDRGYLLRVATLQQNFGCKAHVEVSGDGRDPDEKCERCDRRRCRC